jgi:hypothetical protein
MKLHESEELFTSDVCQCLGGQSIAAEVAIAEEGNNQLVNLWRDEDVA